MIWTDEDRAIMAGMKRAGLTNKAIAKRLGRTEPAIANQARKAKAYRRLDHHGGGVLNRG